MKVYLIIDREKGQAGGYVRAVYAYKNGAQEHATNLRRIYAERFPDEPFEIEVHEHMVNFA